MSSDEVLISGDVREVGPRIAQVRAECRARSITPRSITPRIARRGVETSERLGRHRWVVERTFGWMIRWRRLVRDYERRLDVSEAMIHVAMGALLLRRVAHR